MCRCALRCSNKLLLAGIDQPSTGTRKISPSTSTKKIRVNWSASSATGTEPTGAKHFAWRTTFVANELPKTGHNAAGPRSSSLLAA
jgi:hypothetical protein